MIEITPTISICITTYNHEKYIKNAIESVLNQNVSFEIEILVSDDCSSDLTTTVLKSLEKKYPNLIITYNIINLGICNNFYSILKKAKGKYIAILDGDDYWVDPYKLQNQINILENNTEYGLVYTNYISKENKTNKTEPIQYKLNAINSIDDLYQQTPFILPSTIMFRRDLISDLQLLDESIFFNGDVLLYNHLILKTKFKLIKEYTTVYRVLENSASHITNRINHYKFYLKVYNTDLYFQSNYSIDAKKIKSSRLRIFEYKIKLSLFTCNFEEFILIDYDPKLFSFHSKFNIKILTLFILFFIAKNKYIFIITSKVVQKFYTNKFHLKLN